MRIASIFGTRPEAIKMAPVILKLRERAEHETVVLVTGQHKEMLQEALDAFGIRPDLDLALMRHDQTLADLTARGLVGTDTEAIRSWADRLLSDRDTYARMTSAANPYGDGHAADHILAAIETCGLTHVATSVA